MILIDTHCHLQFSDYDTDRAMVIGNAKKAGVKQFIVPGVDAYSSRQAIELAQKHPGIVFAAIGFHPYEASHDPNLKMLESFISELPTTNHQPLTIIAIGEIGLDYHLFKDETAAGKKNQQKHLFSAQLQLALKYHLPAILHCRDAYSDFFDIIDSLPTLPKGVIHCFSGGLQELRIAENKHLFVGLDGNLTYSKHLQTIIPQIPLTQLLLETDSPYLTPIPHRGSRNEPKYLSLIAKAIANLKAVSVTEIINQTTLNAQCLFALPVS